ncbi:hypothetical protein PUR29_36500 [Methylobacterium ajmalii]|uniref:Uncharacterized protein n=1 Tax=Methylobacterium ajmalii TaxID=2738439 RepID=A0ABV0A522_9HYPH
MSKRVDKIGVASMIEAIDVAKQFVWWVGPPLLWIGLFKVLPDFLGNNFIKALEARRSAVLERLKGEIARQNAAEIEAIKAELQVVSSTVKTSADFLIASQGELRGKTIAAAEILWSEMLRLAEDYASIIFVDTILNKNEINDLVEGKLKHNGYFDLEEYRDIKCRSSKLMVVKELDKARLFVGDRLWLIFFNYRAIIGRYTYLMSESFDNKKLRHWHDDKNIKSMLLSTLNQKTVAEIMALEIGGLQHALSYINAAFLKEAARVMSGSSAFAASLTDVQATLLVAAESASARSTNKNDDYR